MRIEVLPVTGSPRNITPDDIEGRGVGGSELFLMRLMEQFGQYGYEVTVYNDPYVPGKYGNVNYLPNYAFDPNGDKDRIIILFRGYDSRVQGANYRKVIGISTDQYTVGNYDTDFYPAVSKMIGISEFHKADHIIRYPRWGNTMQVIDIGSDCNEYPDTTIQKDNGLCIYTSVPDRGLNYLLDYWPEIKHFLPYLHLVITSDYRLWGTAEPLNDAYKQIASQLPDISFLGKISRSELVSLQLRAEANLLPNTYDENFCIAGAEATMAGCMLISSNKGALATTNITEGLINSNPSNGDFKTKFIDKTVAFFSLPIEVRQGIQKDIRYRAHKKYDWKNIFPKWLEIINE